MTKFMGKISRKRSLMMAGLLAGSFVAGGAAWSTAGAGTATAPAPLALAPAANQATNQVGFADLVAKVKPAVVNIASTGMRQTAAPQAPDSGPDTPFGQDFQQFFGQNGQMQQQQAEPSQALGSGFIVDPAGYVVTNNHVIDGAQEIKVTLSDGSSYPAKIVGRDQKTDLALLKIDADKTLPYVAFGDSDKERVGDWVVAVGNPFGLGGTVTAGIVSAHGRNIGEGPYDDFLQIDAPINPGNSGGPLFDQSGHVVGIDTAIYSPNGGSVGIGFAIPSKLASNVVAQLREHGNVERGWLGVQMQAVTPALAKAVGLPKDEGVLVDKVEANSPAQQAGLQQGDVITAYNGNAIATTRDLAMAVANTRSGQTVKLALWRDGHETTADVDIRTQSPDRTAEADAPSGKPVGMALAELTPDMRDQLGLGAADKGVVVAQVTPGSPAAASGLQPGDVILRVGGEAVSTPQQAAGDVHAAQRAKKASIPLLISRGGQPSYLALQLANS